MKNDLFDHQKQGVDFVIQKSGSGALFHEIGCGKTRTALEIYARLRQSEESLKMLVISPLSLLNAAWREDNTKFYGFRFCNLRESSWIAEKHGRPIALNDDIFAVNYESLLSKSKLEGIVWMLRLGNPWLCVLDESARIKSAQAQTTKIIFKMIRYFKYRIILSGCPAPNSEMEYFPQMQFVAPGCLGTNMTAFRSHFFHLANRYSNRTQSLPPFMTKEIFTKGWNYAITPAKREELMNLIMPHCHLAKKKDCLDLPEQVDEIRFVELEGEQKKVYLEMKKYLVVEIEEQKIAAPLALTKLMKLRQITSGFIYNEKGDSYETNLEHDDHFKMSLETKMPFVKNEPGEENFWGDAFNPLENEFSNPKLKELFAIIEEAGNQPIIVWINFHWEQIKICHELHKRFGENQVVTLSALTKDKDESIKAFQEGRARFLVAHGRSAGHGLTMIQCSLQIFFSLDYSWEIHEQSRGRIHRFGQIKKCTYVYILAKDTIDESIFNVLKNKKDAQEIIYETIKSSL